MYTHTHTHTHTHIYIYIYIYIYTLFLFSNEWLISWVSFHRWGYALTYVNNRIIFLTLHYDFFGITCWARMTIFTSNKAMLINPSLQWRLWLDAALLMGMQSISYQYIVFSKIPFLHYVTLSNFSNIIYPLQVNRVLIQFPQNGSCL